jgi:hypothetical protein
MNEAAGILDLQIILIESQNSFPGVKDKKLLLNVQF